MPVYRYKGVAAGLALEDLRREDALRTQLRARGAQAVRVDGRRDRPIPRGHEASELLAKLQLPSLLRVPDLALAMF